MFAQLIYYAWHTQPVVFAVLSLVAVHDSCSGMRLPGTALGRLWCGAGQLHTMESVIPGGAEKDTVTQVADDVWALVPVSITITIAKAISFDSLEGATPAISHVMVLNAIAL